MSYKLEPNNNNSPTSFNTKQVQTIDKLKQVSGQANVPLTDDRAKKVSNISGKEYVTKYRKDDKGKYIRNVSAASMQNAIGQTTNDKYKKINQTIDRNRQTVKKMDIKREQNYNPYS